MKLTQDRADTKATDRRNIFCDDIGRSRRGSAQFQFELPAYGTEHVIAGIRAGDRAVGVKYELAPANPTYESAKTRRDDLDNGKGPEGGIDDDEQRGAERDFQGPDECATRRRCPAHGTMG